MMSDDEINKLTYQIIMNYNSTHSRTAGNIHPGKLQDAVRKALKETED